MRARGIVLAAVLIALAAAGPARADWLPRDPYKMHYPQLPSYTDNWDIQSSMLADDWQCSGTGPVSDIHIWTNGSGIRDYPPVGWSIQVKIFGNDPSGGHSIWDPNIVFSTPADLLWSGTFGPGQYATRYEYMPEPEGWDPNVYGPWEDTQTGSWQINITDIADPFVQTEGAVYWLGIQAQATLPDDPVPYWNSSASPQFMDDSVWWWDQEGFPPQWQSLQCCAGNPTPTDMAFVITPEPATLGLLAIGALALIRRRPA
jgi:hypothetical protein